MADPLAAVRFVGGLFLLFANGFFVTRTNVEGMADSPHVRFPLVGESLDEFHGIVYTPAVLRYLGKETSTSATSPPR